MSTSRKNGCATKEKSDGIDLTADADKSNIGGMVTFGEGVFDSTAVPLGIFTASFCSGVRNAFTRSEKNKKHVTEWKDAFYGKGEDEKKVGLHYGSVAADGAQWLGETTGYVCGSPFAIALGCAREVYRASQTKSEYKVNPRKIGKN